MMDSIADASDGLSTDDEREPDQARDLARRLRRAEVEFVIFDEAQELFPQEKNKF
jgi:hypothetical protein